jgi:dTDP-4-dehydrorhamnose reductase
MCVNRDGTAHVARATAEVGARLVYMSTDYVFDGAASRPYPPDAEVAPASVYARSKAEGEAAALEAPGTVVVRTGWLYGAFGRNFVATMIDRAREGRPLRVVDDQRGRPTWTRNVAHVVFDLMDEGVEGVWHVADTGIATWLELARTALRVSGLDDEVEGVSTAVWGAAAARPAYSVLDLARTERVLGRSMERWEDALERFLSGDEIDSAP